MRLLTACIFFNSQQQFSHPIHHVYKPKVLNNSCLGLSRIWKSLLWTLYRPHAATTTQTRPHECMFTRARTWKAPCCGASKAVVKFSRWGTQYRLSYPLHRTTSETSSVRAPRIAWLLFTLFLNGTWAWITSKRLQPNTFPAINQHKLCTRIVAVWHRTVVTRFRLLQISQQKQIDTYLLCLCMEISQRSAFLIGKHH